MYQWENWGLFLSGEAFPLSSHRLALVLGKIPTIEKVFNFGICGGLSSKYPIKTGYWIRQFYLENHLQEFQFQSYTGEKTNQESPDLITVGHRLIHPQQAKKLYPLAPLVDREAWGQAQVCYLHGIPFSSFKVVSDFIDPNISELDTDPCKIIQDGAGEYSKILYAEWEKLGLSLHLEALSKAEKTLHLSKILSEETSTPTTWSFLENQTYHWTFSLKRKVGALLRQLVQRGFSEEKLKDHILKFSSENKALPPKEQSRKLIQSLQELSNPLHFKINSFLKELFQVKKQKSLNISFDPSLERTELLFDFSIKNPEELPLICKELEELTAKQIPKQFFQVLQGELDVSKNTYRKKNHQ